MKPVNGAGRSNMAHFSHPLVNVRVVSNKFYPFGDILQINHHLLCE